MENRTTPFLDSNRIICVSEKFDYALYKYTIERLFSCDKNRLDENKICRDILVYIDSYGGDLSKFLGLHDIMHNILYSDVATICTSWATSAAGLLLLSGTKGKRFCTPNATIMLHSSTGETRGNIKEVDNYVENMWKREEKRMVDIILKRTKITKKQLKDIMSKDTWLSAEECLKLGIIDHIIKKPNDLYSKINI